MTEQAGKATMGPARYRVTTWDSERQEFTPQKGVRCGPWSKWGLRRALRCLSSMGYDTSRGGGYSVLVERIDVEAAPPPPPSGSGPAATG